MTCYVNLPLMRSINDMTSYLETLKCGDRLFFLPTLINYYTTSPVIKETNGVDFFFGVFFRKFVDQCFGPFSAGLVSDGVYSRLLKETQSLQKDLMVKVRE